MSVLLIDQLKAADGRVMTIGFGEVTVVTVLCRHCEAPVFDHIGQTMKCLWDHTYFEGADRTQCVIRTLSIEDEVRPALLAIMEEPDDGALM